MSLRLTIGDLAAIASAPPEATPVEFARQLGKPAEPHHNPVTVRLRVEPVAYP